MKVQNIPITDVTKKKMVLHVKITGVKIYRYRLKVAILLIKLAGLVAGMGIEFKDKE